MNMKKHLSKVFILILIVVAALVWYIYSGLKFIPPHFHANFAMYVNGERVDFTADRYSEDIAGCKLTGLMYPADRVHLHENNQDTIHIHHEGVSFGHFFANNWFGFTDNYLANDSGKLFFAEGENKMTFILNWKKIENPFNRLIKSKDRLLISYGSESELELMSRYETVSDNAGEYNAKYDPGSCGWTNENGMAVLIHDLLHPKH